MLTFTSSMDFSQSTLFLDVSFQFLILHLLIPVCTHFHHLFSGYPLSRLPWRLFLNTWLIFLFLSILLTQPIQINWLILRYENIFKSPNSCINSLLYCCSFDMLGSKYPLSISSHLRSTESLPILLQKPQKLLPYTYSSSSHSIFKAPKQTFKMSYIAGDFIQDSHYCSDFSTAEP